MPTPPKTRVIPAGTVRMARGDNDGNEQAVLDFLQSYINEHGYSPTITEIGVHINRARPTVNNFLASLEGKGYIRRAPNSRAIVTVFD